jgi:DNA-binding transcriptional ArsR family regulator
MVKCSPERLTQIFGALSDETRRKIVAKLSRGPQCVTELAAPFEMSLPAVSKHLTILEGAGLVTRERMGRTHWLKLEPAALKQAGDWIESYRKFWEESFDRLDEHLKDIQKTEKKNAKSKSKN